VDEQTIQRAQRGSRDAQAVLLRALQDPWFRLARSLTAGDEDRARDATQETALRFLRLLPTFRGESKLATWSMGIVINVVREMRRRSDKPKEAEEALRLASLQRSGPISPDDAARTAEEAELLRKTLDDLPERQREAVILRFFEELSVEETATAMQCAPGTVKATVHQALKALKERLKQLS